jgi:glyoxylase-like metal-dependent hydrolase (beta-lactamase superfamily II)
MTSLLIQLSEHLYQFTDTCNVYLVCEGNTGLLIDAGSGAILDHMANAGVEQIEWVLHTHHHRDQCWGTPRLIQAGAAIAVPEYERYLFAQAELFWQTRRIYDNYDDRNTFFTLGHNIPVAATLDDYTHFEWRGHRFYVLPAKGHTLGSSTLLAQIDNWLIAFTGDLLYAGGRLYQLHAMEYMYGSAEGILFTLQSIQALRKKAPHLCLPSHGPIIRDVLSDIQRLERRLMDCVRLGRGLRIAGRDSMPETAFLPEPKMIPLSPHLLWGGSWTCSNFYVVLSQSGKALFIDYGHAFFAHMHIGADHGGLETMRFIEHHLDELRDDYGVKAFDLAIPTHIHDDHTVGIPHLQRHHGTRCWALRQVAEPLMDPAAWASTPCLFPKPIQIERVLEDGERFTWEEYTFEVFHAPGQTEFHSIIAGMIDGRKVAFTGDNIFNHEVMLHGNQIWVEPYETTVFRNSFRLEMHRQCAAVMRRITPEVVCPGHRDILYFTKRELDTYCNFIERKEKVFRELVDKPANQYIDLFWVRLLPYLCFVEPGQTVEYQLLLRNNFSKPSRFEARLLPPPGWTMPEHFAALELAPEAQGELKLQGQAPQAGDGRRRLITAEVRINGVSQGPVAEALVTVKPRQ